MISCGCAQISQIRCPRSFTPCDGPCRSRGHDGVFDLFLGRPSGLMVFLFFIGHDDPQCLPVFMRQKQGVGRACRDHRKKRAPEVASRASEPVRQARPGDVPSPAADGRTVYCPPTWPVLPSASDTGKWQKGWPRPQLRMPGQWPTCAVKKTTTE